MRSTVPTWLPPEIVVVQPYSMGPLLHWDPPMPVGFTAPASGTARLMDDGKCTGGLQAGADFAILGCLIAPHAVQREAQAAGETGLIWLRPKGLVEAIAAMPGPRGGSHGGVGADSVRGRKAQRRVADDRKSALEAEPLPQTSLADLIAAAEDDD